MHNSPLIGAGSGAADSPFLSRAAPFSLCLPAAPADAAADEETRRGRQRSRPALPSPGRHRHGSFRSRLSGSPAISGERPAGCLSCAGGLRCPGSRGWGAGGGLGPLVQSRGVLQLPAALSPPGMAPRTPKNSLAQEKWGHGHTKPCSPMLGWPASGPGAGRVTVQGVPVPLWHSGGGHSVPCRRQEHTRRGHLRMSPAGGSKGGGVVLQPTPRSAWTTLLLPWKLPAEHPPAAPARETRPPLSPASPTSSQGHPGTGTAPARQAQSRLFGWAAWVQLGAVGCCGGVGAPQEGRPGRSRAGEAWEVLAGAAWCCSQTNPAPTRPGAPRCSASHKHKSFSNL